jgi:ADP-ribose pyrophosphatase YjhB (NUDIX family)
LRSEVLELDASTATALDGDSPASPASEVATHVSRDDEPTPRLMPLWRGLGDVLTQRLITCGLITWGDTPHEVAVDTSIEDIAAVVPLTVDDAASLRNIGFHSGDSFLMPPPPPRNTRPKSACILYIGYSAHHGEVCAIMLQLRRANSGGRQRWCTPGGELTDGERPEHAALRETCEELLSMPDDLASAYATALLARDSGELTGPFGSTERHHAYILCRLLGNVDDLVATFTPNDEVDAACAVPLSAIKGSALTVELDGTSLQLRDKIGYMRMQAAHALCAADPSMVGHSPDLAVITPAARTTALPPKIAI